MTDTKIAVYDGKYTFVCPEGDWRIHILRYDEPWLIIEKGHKAVLALMDELLHDRMHFANTQAIMAAAICAAPPAQYTHALDAPCPSGGRTCPECRFNDLRASLRDLAQNGTKTAPEAPVRPVLMTCGHCGRDDAYATCVGSYEGHEQEGPACDECCGHGCEDGYCWPLQQAGYVRSLKEAT